MLLIEIMFKGKLLLQTTFVSVRCFRTVTSVPFPKVSVWQRVPCDTEGRERGGGGLTCRRGSTGHRVAAAGPSCSPLTPVFVADHPPPQFRDCFCSIKGIITNGQASACSLPWAQPVQLVSRMVAEAVPGPEWQGPGSAAKRGRDGDRKTAAFCTKMCRADVRLSLSQ